MSATRAYISNRCSGILREASESFSTCRVHGGRVYASTPRFWAIVVLLVCTEHGQTKVQADRPSEPHRHHSESRCCSDATCSSSSRSQYAFVASIRTAYYMTGLRELHCSLQRSNPDIPLIVISVDGDLDEQHISEIESFATYRAVQEIRQPPNIRNPRFGLNWMKLRAWELTEYDALIMLDVDTAVLRDLSHLFSLPTDFAWAPYQVGSVPCCAQSFCMLHTNHEICHVACGLSAVCSINASRPSCQSLTAIALNCRGLMTGTGIQAVWCF